MRIIRELVLTLAVLTILSSSTVAQLAINNSMNATQLVDNVLLGQGVTATNIQFNGDAVQIGYFNGVNSNIGLDSGVVMSTGNIADLVPGSFIGITTTTVTDNDLHKVANSVPPLIGQSFGPIGSINNAAVLEFDFKPTGDSLVFNYVFSSNEYLIYINTLFNDAFGFFISGPGITPTDDMNYASFPAILPSVGADGTPDFDPQNILGTSYNPQNIAIVPGSNPNIPITISSVQPSLNSQYYIDNPGNTTVQQNGFTTVLTAIATNLQCDETYHIKLAIGHGQDFSLESGVFLEAQSFSSNSVSISAGGQLGGDSTIVEGCNDAAIFTFSRPDTSQDFTVNLIATGTATNGVDYSSIPDSITIPAGTLSQQLIIEAIVDNISEPLETITLSINYFNGCRMDTVEASMYVVNLDSVNINLASTNDTICTQDPLNQTFTLEGSATGGSGNLTYSWHYCESTAFPWGSSSNPFDNNACDSLYYTNKPPGDTVYSIIAPTNATSYVLVAWDTCGYWRAAPMVEIFVQCPAKVPSVFTPNGDSYNETFHVLNSDQHQGAKLEVFNRYGVTVYENENYENDWDGVNMDGVKLHDGVYYYLVTLNSGKGQFQGYVTLLGGVN